MTCVNDTNKIYAKGLCRNCYDNKKYEETKNKKHKQRKEWRKNNKDKVKKQKAKWYEKYKDIIKKRVSDYQKTEMGKLVMNRKRQKRRTKKLELLETYTTQEWNEKLDKTMGICPGCKTFVGKNKLEIDHIIPVSKAKIGYVYTICGVQPLCKSCNCKKGTEVINYE